MSGVAYYFSLGGKIEAGLTTLFEWEENGEELGVGGSSIPCALPDSNNTAQGLFKRMITTG